MNAPSDFLPDDLPAGRDGSDARAAYLIVRARGGLLDGEFMKVPLGATVTLGRSRRCDFSLKKSARYLLSSGQDRADIRARIAYRAVSRHHCSIRFVSPSVVEITNHSHNGTFVDGLPVATIRLGDIRHMAHEVRLGRHGDGFDLEFGSLATLPEDSISR